MNEQKENGWWKKEFDRRFTISGKITHETPLKGLYQTFIRWATKPDPDTIKAFISQVEQDARKDERERVLGEAIELIESAKLEEVPPFSASNESREKATLINKNLMPLVKARLIKALKGLSDNNK